MRVHTIRVFDDQGRDIFIDSSGDHVVLFIGDDRYDEPMTGDLAGTLEGLLSWAFERVYPGLVDWTQELNQDEWSKVVTDSPLYYVCVAIAKSA